MPRRFPGACQMVMAEMKVRDGRETLSRTRVKLREGDAVKSLKELMILRGEHQEDCLLSLSPAEDAIQERGVLGSLPFFD